MKNNRIGIGILGCLAVVTAVQAVSENPYQKVVGRNVFGLKAPPLPSPPHSEPPPVPRLQLQGITSILGRRQVLFREQMPPSGGRPGVDRGYILSEGQREDEVEVMAINLAEGTVKFNNHGVIQVLDMKTDSAKASPGAALSVAMAKSPIPVLSRPPGEGEDSSGRRQIPQSNNHTITQEEGEASPETTATTDAAPTPPANEPPPMSVEEQTVLIEVNRENTKEEVKRGEMPPLPPTDLTPPDALGMPDSPRSPE